MSPLDRIRFVRDLAPDSIGPNGKLCLYALSARAGKAGLCYPSYRALAKDTGLSNSTIKRTMKTLEEIGLIQRQRRYRRSTLYALQFEAFAAVYPEALRTTSYEEQFTVN